MNCLARHESKRANNERRPGAYRAIFVPGLARVSYFVGSANEAVVVDPERNVGGYVTYVARNKLILTAIFLTHPHADFVAGHAELSARSGAPIFVSGKAPATFVHNYLQ
jgi:glyoxylase-like metal-dependent hydrolase (beta-lactamase superfamily II)